MFMKKKRVQKNTILYSSTSKSEFNHEIESSVNSQYENSTTTHERNNTNNNKTEELVSINGIEIDPDSEIEANLISENSSPPSSPYFPNEPAKIPTKKKMRIMKQKFTQFLKDFIFV